MGLPKIMYLGSLVLMLATIIMVEAASTPPGIAKNPARASCNKREYKMCYNLEHVCPKFCPDSCTVECASCKPICSGGSSPPPPAGGEEDDKGGKKEGNDGKGKEEDKEGGDKGGKKEGDGDKGKEEDKEGDKGGKKEGDKGKGKEEDKEGDEKGGKKDGDGDKGKEEDKEGDKGGKKEGDGKKGKEEDKEGGDGEGDKGGKKRGDGDKDDDEDKDDKSGKKEGDDDDGKKGGNDNDSGSPPPYYPPSPTPSTPKTPSPSTPKPTPPSPTTPSPSTPKPTPPSPPPPTTPTPSPKTPTPSPPTPSSPPPNSSGVSPRKRVRCQNKNYGQCYNQQHICPASCPTSCQVDCVTCKPVCSCDYPGAVCQDPRFIGGDGITFYFHGKKNQDFCLVTDQNLHINAHFIGKRNQNMGRDFTWVESIGILFDNHRLFIGAKKTSTWNDANDRLSLAFDGIPLDLDETLDYQWKSTSTPQVTITRTNTKTNNIVVEVQGKLKIIAQVVPITEHESRVHNYGITKEDCFAHLDLGFKFLSLTRKVEGVLGKTYKEDYISKVNVGANMAVMGGEKEYASSSIFATDCLASRFNNGDHYDDEGVSPLEVASMKCVSGMNGEAGVVCKR
ncbi:Halomucin [Bienertia sinuspersici]